MDVNTWMLCCETGSFCGLGRINIRVRGETSQEVADRSRTIQYLQPVINE